MTSAPPPTSDPGSGWAQPTYSDATAPPRADSGAPRADTVTAPGTAPAETAASVETAPPAESAASGAPASAWPFQNPPPAPAQAAPEAPSAPPPPPPPAGPQYGAPGQGGYSPPPSTQAPPPQNYGPPPGFQPGYQQGPQAGYPQGPPPGAPYPSMASGYPAPQSWTPAGAPSAYNAPQVEIKMPQVAWLIPVAAVLAVVGAFTPWFKPEADQTSSDGNPAAHFVGAARYSWKDGRIGLLAPILLVVLAISVIGLARGKAGARFTRGSTGPVRSAGRGAMIIAVVSGVCLTIAYFLVQTQYKIDVGAGDQSWGDAEDYVKSRGGTLTISHGIQIGFWLTVAAAALALIAGAVMFFVKPKETSATPPMLRK